jgi:hypothetical protein
MLIGRAIRCPGVPLLAALNQQSATKTTTAALERKPAVRALLGVLHARADKHPRQQRTEEQLVESAADELKGRVGEERVASNPPWAHDTLMPRICTIKPPVSGGAARSVPRITVSHILIGDLTLRWIVTILFGVSIATYVYILVAQHDRQTSTVNHLLHLTMSAAMIVMAWRVGVNLPTVGPMIFFLLAGVWFVRVAGRVSSATRDRLTNYYYAVKMAAMAWMYAVMNGSLPGQTGHSPDHALSGSLAMNMSGMDMSMSGMEMPAHEMSPTLPGPGWITTVNWIAALGFAVVALYWPCRCFAGRRMNPVPHAAQLARLEPLYQAFTAAGTAVMFGALL